METEEPEGFAFSSSWLSPAGSATRLSIGTILRWGGRTARRNFAEVNAEALVAGHFQFAQGDRAPAEPVADALAAVLVSCRFIETPEPVELAAVYAPTGS